MTNGMRIYWVVVQNLLCVSPRVLHSVSLYRIHKYDMQSNYRSWIKFTGGLCDDFLSHLMCCCCALVQEMREMEIRGVYGMMSSPCVLVQLKELVTSETIYQDAYPVMLFGILTV
ncbi:hypothetical protein Syun_005458 [Stephania yunnanensis]|uniref:Uncharacterized protein n=1 Tax=Stephania yunnanensis TaxID=152371 RepID=A0AAP0L537_9MAGN